MHCGQGGRPRRRLASGAPVGLRLVGAERAVQRGQIKGQQHQLLEPGQHHALRLPAPGLRAGLRSALRARGMSSASKPDQHQPLYE